MTDFVTFFGSLRLVPDDLSFIVFFFQFVEAFASFVFPWSLFYMSYVYSILQATPFHFSGTKHRKLRLSVPWYFLLFSCQNLYMTQLLLLGKFEYTGGPIFKVVLEC